MNFNEKSVRSMSSSLPNRSHLEERDQADDPSYCYTIYSDNIKNPPRMVTSTDDGSGTASYPKNIINSRRRSESYAMYSNSSPRNSFDDSSLLLQSHQFNPEDLAYYNQDGSIQSNHLYPHTLNVDKKIVLYKTEMCRTFEETGNCKYGIKCQFAHDPIEIRNIPRHPRYKTEICKTFWQLGNCPYGKRCCFIHTENELKDPKNSTSSPSTSNTTGLSASNSQHDLYGSVDLIISEDNSILADIQSQNTSRSPSPSKLAEDLKKSINNLGANSIFNNLSISNLNNLVSSKSITERRRKSIINDYGKIEELSLLIGSNCSLKQTNSNHTDNNNNNDAPSSEDPEFKSIQANPFELWSRESPKTISTTEESPGNIINTLPTEANNLNFNKFALYDKSPGSRSSTGIWTSLPSNNQVNQPTNSKSFFPGSQFYETEHREAQIDCLISSIPSGISSSKSSSSNHQQILIDMLNLLDSSS